MTCVSIVWKRGREKKRVKKKKENSRMCVSKSKLKEHPRAGVKVRQRTCV